MAGVVVALLGACYSQSTNRESTRNLRPVVSIVIGWAGDQDSPVVSIALIREGGPEETWFNDGYPTDYLHFTQEDLNRFGQSLTRASPTRLEQEAFDPTDFPYPYGFWNAYVAVIEYVDGDLLRLEPHEDYDCFGIFECLSSAGNERLNGWIEHRRIHGQCRFCEDIGQVQH